MDDRDENPHTSKPNGSQPSSLQSSRPATPAEILTHMTALGSWYFAKDLSDGQRRVLLKQMCEDLAGKTEAQIAHACKRWRTSPNTYFPTSGQLLELIKNPYADAPSTRGQDWHTRLGFGGGGCTCPRCTSKEHREGFFVAPAEAYRESEKLRAELDYDTERRMVPSRLDDAEMDLRSLLVNDLVRAGMGYEQARRKVMVERTKALYPEFKIWPALGAERDDTPERSDGP